MLKYELCGIIWYDALAVKLVWEFNRTWPLTLISYVNSVITKPALTVGTNSILLLLDHFSLHFYVIV